MHTEKADTVFLYQGDKHREYQNNEKYITGVNNVPANEKSINLEFTLAFCMIQMFKIGCTIPTHKLTYRQHVSRTI